MVDGKSNKADIKYRHPPNSLLVIKLLHPARTWHKILMHQEVQAIVQHNISHAPIAPLK